MAAALDTAARIGDDFIQTQLGGGRVDESQFSHGSSAQREKWCTTGYQTGDPAQLRHLRPRRRPGLSPFTRAEQARGTRRRRLDLAASTPAGRSRSAVQAQPELSSAGAPRRATVAGAVDAGSPAAPTPAATRRCRTNAADARPQRAEVVERELQHGGAHLGAEPAPLVRQPEPGPGVDLPDDREVGAPRCSACRSPGRRAGPGSAPPTAAGRAARAATRSTAGSRGPGRRGSASVHGDQERHLARAGARRRRPPRRARQARVVVGAQLQPGGAQHQVPQRPVLGRASCR